MIALHRRWFRAAPTAAIRSVARSHVGRVRHVNEDRVLACDPARLWAVADGMGGHSAGDVAAGIAVAALQVLARAGEPTRDGVLATIAAANRAILDQAGDARVTGTTLVAATLAGASAEIFWAGDSRAYRLRGAAMTQLTRDHSLVQELVDAGTLPPALAERHPQANVVTRALGIGESLAVARTTCRLAAGDRLLLCSDGLSRSLDARDLDERLPLDAQADRLLTNALRRDGSDNVSLVLIALD